MPITVLDASEFNKPFWIDWQINPKSTRYNLCLIYQLSPQLDVNQLSDALKKVVCTHYNLRSTFKEINGQLKQFVSANSDASLNKYASNSTVECQKFIDQSCDHHFNLEAGPLFQFTLIHNTEENHYIFLVNCHHIILDGHDFENIVNKIKEYYFDNSKPAILDEDSLIAHQQYIEFEKNTIIKKNNSSWAHYLADYSLLSDLPYDKKNDTHEQLIQSNNYTLNDSVYKKILEFKAEHHYSLFQIIKVAWSFVLSRYCDNQPIVLSHPVSIRRSQYTGIKGAFVNTLLFYYTESGSFLDQLKQAREQIKLHQNRNLPILHLLAQIKKEIPHIETQSLLKLGIAETNLRLMNKSDTIFERAIPTKDLATAELALEYEVIEDCFHFRINYLSHLFSSELIVQLSGHFQNALTNFLSCPTQKTSQISLLTSSEYKKILVDWNETETPISIESLYQAFDSQANRTPNNNALFCAGNILSYSDLKVKTDKLAEVIKYYYQQHLGRDVIDGDIVGIYMDYSFDTIISLIAVMKAGAAYLPLDQSYPEERIRWMVQDANIQFLITNIPTKMLANSKIQSIDINTIPQDAYSKQPITPNVNQNALAYIIYTSGTTGKPKGVLIRQQSAVNTITAMNKVLKLKAESKVLQFVSFGFDVFVQEVFCTLSQGACLYIPSATIKQDFHLLTEYIQEHKIDHILGLPAAALETLPLLDNSSLKQILIGGETPAKRALDSWLNRVRLINAYGPTEATICVTSHTYRSGDIASIIGKPIGNMKVYVLDHHLNPCPTMVKGELYISGIGLSQGYLHLPDQTQKNFIKNSFIQSENNPYSMLYKTGDIVRWRFDGTLDYSHRNDQQIKLRGYRIELNEIEMILSQYPAIQQCVVMVSNHESHRYLVSYYVPMQNETISSKLLKEYLAQHLPYYMIPVDFIKIENMPTTINGKVDRKVLTTLGKSDSPSPHSAGRTIIETHLLKIWCDLLKIESIEVDDHFLYVGGHSLLALELINRIKSEFAVNITVKHVFEYPILSDLAKFIEDALDSPPLFSIKKVEDQQYYAASSAQSALYFINQSEEQVHALYNFPLIIEISNTIEMGTIRDIFNTLIQRHEILRTHFNFINGRVVQYINETVSFDIIVIPGSNQPEDILPKIKKLIQKPFSVKECPLFHIYVMQTGGDYNVLLFNAHHIIIDGASAEILMREINQLIRGESLPPRLFQYKDYAEYQYAMITHNQFEAHKNYWLNQIDSEIPYLQLPGDYPDTKNQKYQGNQFALQLDETLTNELKQFCDAHHLTTNSVLFSVFAIVLSKYTSQNEIMIGLPTTNRPYSELSDIIGMFINMLSIKVMISPATSTLEFIQSVQDVILSGLAHQEYPFEELVKLLNVPRTSTHPIFNVVFNYNTLVLQPDEAVRFSEYNAKLHSFIAKFDLCLTIYQINAIQKTSYWMSFEYSTMLFSHEIIKRFSENTIQTLKQVLHRFNEPIQAIDILSNAEKNLLINHWIPQPTIFPLANSLSELIEKRVKISPHQPAIEWEKNYLSYDQLNRSANQLAHYIREVVLSNSSQTTLSNSIIGVCLPRGIDILVSIIAILKSGAAYLLLDPDFPNERLLFMANDAECKLILSFSKYENQLSGLQCPLRYLDEHKKIIENQPQHNLPNCNKEKDLAYVIYTSGTTGKPKGTLIQHYNVINLIYSMQKRFPLDESSKVTQFSSLSFDGLIAEIFPSLAFGATLSIVPDECRHDSQLLYSFILERNINTILYLPPIILSQLPLLPKNQVKVIFIGGEVCSKKTMDIWAKRTQLVNGYGPAETTVYATLGLHQSGQRITLGKPIDNVQIVILDKNRNILPIGAIGEIYIAGAGVGKGYLNLPDLTRGKYIDYDIFPHSKLYQTGDYGRWLSNGDIEYLGRQDSHVKLRGFRIELTEIEITIESHPLVKKCVVLLKETNNDKHLVAYYVLKGPLDQEILYEYLYNKLPVYMIPAFFVTLDQFPLTKNEKIDKKRLPDPHHSFVEKETTGIVLTSLEKKIKRIFSDILGTNHFTIFDDFFRLGGHSLSAMQLANQIKQDFNIDLPTKFIFEYPTVSGLSKIISQQKITQYQSIPKALNLNSIEATPVQRGIYLHQHSLGMQSLQYNIAVLFRIKDSRKNVRLKLANIVDQLVKKHDIFRLSFHFHQGKLLLKRNDHVDLSIEELDYQNESESFLKEQLSLLLGKPFQLDQAPLILAYLLYTNENEHIFVLISHHIILDGSSLEILQSDIQNIYNDKNTIESNCQFIDYASYQYDFMKSHKFIQQKEYWLNALSPKPSRLKLPIDYDATSQPNIDGLHHSAEINLETVNLLRETAKSLRITEHSVLFSALSLVLQRYSEENHFIIGVPVYGRSHPDTKNIVGMFANTLCIPVSIYLNHSPLEHLTNINDVLLTAYENQDYPLDDLIDAMKLSRQPTRHPLIDVMFSYQHFKTKRNDQHSHIERIELEKENLSIGSIFDLSFFITENKDKVLKLTIQYRSSLFKPATIVDLSMQYSDMVIWLLKNLHNTILLSDICTTHSVSQTEVSTTRLDTPRFAAPRNRTEQELLDIWKEALEIQELSINDNFFDLGGNSLSAMFMLELVAEKFPSASISLFSFQNDPTIVNLSEQLSNHTSVIEHPYVVPLQPHGSQKPLFIFPGFIGFSAGYKDLADVLGKEYDLPVYGIQMQGLLQNDMPLNSIEAIAKKNIDWIRSIQPDGPYRIVGHSFGAIVGYEMAKQLEQQNIANNTLILLDSGPRALINNFERTDKSDNIRIILSILHFLLPDTVVYQLIQDNKKELNLLFAKLAQFENIDIVIEYIITYLKTHSVTMQLNQFQKVFELAKTNASISYTPNSLLNQNIVLVRTQLDDLDIYSHHPIDMAYECLGWSDYCSNINILNSTGNHITMVKSPHIQSYAESLQSILKDYA